MSAATAPCRAAGVAAGAKSVIETVTETETDVGGAAGVGAAAGAGIGAGIGMTVGTDVIGTGIGIPETAAEAANIGIAGIETMGNAGVTMTEKTENAAGGQLIVLGLWTALPPACISWPGRGSLRVS